MSSISSPRRTGHVAISVTTCGDSPGLAGADAFRSGEHIGSCPHPHGSQEGNAWRRGYIVAQSNHEHATGGYERRHSEARSVLAREALTPEQQHVAALFAEVEDATQPLVDIRELFMPAGADQFLGYVRSSRGLFEAKPPASMVCGLCGSEGKPRGEADAARRRALVAGERPRPLARCCRKGDLWV